ncbi:hypothetical protein [Candidatus Nitrospira bockiana]
MAKRVSLSGAYAERHYLRHIRDHFLTPNGIHVVARWLDSPVEGDDYLTDTEKATWSQICLEDILASHLHLYFPSERVSCGRHSDFGIAFGLGKPILIVGPRERNIHHYHARIRQVELPRLVEAIGDCLAAGPAVSQDGVMTTEEISAALEDPDPTWHDQQALLRRLAASHEALRRQAFR